MNATLEDTLLDLFHQVIEDPDRIPVVPTDAWPEDSEQGRLLIKLKDRVIGMLSASHSQPGYYTSHHADLALAIANQAAIAIENARLYAQAQDLAALEERQKLARELNAPIASTNHTDPSAL